MPLFACKTCSKQFDHRSNYLAHKNKKNPCKVSDNNSKSNKLSLIHKCNKCKKTFSRTDFLNRHTKSCTGKKIKFNGDDAIVFNTIADHNTANLVLPFDFSTDGHQNITLQELSILAHSKDVWSSLVEIVNFNPNKPQHHNVYYPDLKSGYGVVFINNKWVEMKIFEILYTILNSKINDLKSLLNNTKACLNIHSIHNLQNALNDADLSNRTIRNKIFKYLKTVLHNGKDIVIETRKNIQSILKKGKTIHDLRQSL